MKINFDKNGGLVPAIIQDADTHVVLMLGYMNREAFDKTLESGKVTFFSRSKNKLWTKGETSGNWLNFKQALVDCDKDTLLIKAAPAGPTCHTGQDTCFNEVNKGASFLNHLEDIIRDRKQNMPEESYTTHLFRKGLNKISQKVGEEAIEVIVEALAGNKDLLKEESADLLYHLLVLLSAKEIHLEEVVNVLKKRHKK